MPVACHHWNILFRSRRIAGCRTRSEEMGAGSLILIGGQINSVIFFFVKANLEAIFLRCYVYILWRALTSKRVIIPLQYMFPLRPAEGTIVTFEITVLSCQVKYDHISKLLKYFTLEQSIILFITKSLAQERFTSKFADLASLQHQKFLVRLSSSMFLKMLCLNKFWRCWSW